MRVKILRSVAGVHPDTGRFAFQPGQVVDIHDALARDLVRAGHAERVQRPKRKRKKEASRGG